MRLKAEGWAVVEGAHIVVPTISDSRRAAMVNWLCVRGGILVSNHHTDAEIEAMWQRAPGPKPKVCVVQIITEDMWGGR